MANSIKRQRLDEAAGERQSIVANENHSKLPAELWNGVLGYLFFHDVLSVIATNRFFNRDVPRRVERLLIQKSGSMDVSASAVEKFDGVTEVFVYSLVREIHKGMGVGPVRSLDATTPKRALRFISHLPKLERCFVGGLCTCEDEDHARWTADYVHCDLSYHLGGDRHSDAKYAKFVQSVCHGYTSGELRQNVIFDGVVPEQWGSRLDKPCGWGSLPHRLISHRDDVKCQMCDLLCASFPPMQVMGFSNNEIPCISPENRLKIARCRDPNGVKANLIESLLGILKHKSGTFVFQRPDFTKQSCATDYSEEQFDKMRWLTSNGADVRDPRIRRQLLETDVTYDEETESFTDGSLIGYCLLHKKRIMLLGVYDKLKGFGFDIQRSDFILSDLSDPRSMFGLEL